MESRPRKTAVPELAASALQATNQSAILPMLDWHVIGSYTAAGVGGVRGLAVLDQPRRLVVAGGSGVAWADIPTAAGAAPWVDNDTWNTASGAPPAPFTVALGSRDRTLRTRPQGLVDTTVVVGGDAGGIWVDDWRTGTLTCTQAALAAGSMAGMRATSVTACERFPSRLYAYCCSADNTTLSMVLRSDDGGDTWNVCDYDLEALAGLVNYLGGLPVALLHRRTPHQPGWQQPGVRRMRRRCRLPRRQVPQHVEPHDQLAAAAGWSPWRPARAATAPSSRGSHRRCPVAACSRSLRCVARRPARLDFQERAEVKAEGSAVAHE